MMTAALIDWPHIRSALATGQDGHASVFAGPHDLDNIVDCARDDYADGDLSTVRCFGRVHRQGFGAEPDLCCGVICDVAEARAGLG